MDIFLPCSPVETEDGRCYALTVRAACFESLFFGAVDTALLQAL